MNTLLILLKTVHQSKAATSYPISAIWFIAILAIIVVVLLCILMWYYNAKEKIFSEYNRSSSDLKVKEKELEKVNVELKSKNEALSTTEEKLVETKKNLSVVNMQLGKESKRVDTLSEEKSSLLAQLSVLENAISLSQQEKNVLSEAITNKNNEIASLKESFVKWEAEKIHAEALIGQMQSKIDVINNALFDKNQEMTMLQSEKSSVESALEAAKESISSLSSQLSHSSDVVSQLSAKLAEIEGQKKELEADRTIKDQALSELQSKFIVASTKKEEYKQHISLLDSQISLYKEHIKSKSEEIDVLKQQVTSLTLLIEQKDEKISSSENKNANLSVQIQSLNQQIEDLKNQIEQSSSIDEKEAELEHTIEQLQKANEALNQYKNELDNKNILFDMRGDTISLLQTKLSSTLHEIDKLKLENEELRLQLEESNKKNVVPEAKSPKEDPADNQEDQKNTYVLEIQEEEEANTVVEDSDIEENADTQIEENNEPESSIIEETDLKSHSGKAENVVGPDSHEGLDSSPISEESYSNPAEESDYTEENTSENSENTISSDAKSGNSGFSPSLRGGTKVYGPRHKSPISGTDDDDLPLIVNETGDVKRTILGVFDLESDATEHFISAEEFFSRDADEIARKSRYLSEADEMGRDAFVCACCGNRVKISKRDYGSREVLFFAHCQKDITCEWQSPYHGSSGSGSSGGSPISEGDISKLRTVKTLIMKSLSSEASRAKGVTSVDSDVVLRSQYPFMHWRRAGIHATYKDKSMVFELQTRNILLNAITDKDLFYRLNNHHVVWIFGADEEAGYDYLRKHVQQNTLFANRRNVFIMDSESMAACEERNELVLKCNYLDPDNQWHYRKDVTGNNGILVTLDQLQYDNDLCKPYYYDANIDFFKLHPEAEADYLHSIMSREDIIHDMNEKYEGRKAEARKRKKKQPQIEEPIIEKPESKEPESPQPVITPLGNGRSLYFFEGKYGVIDSDSNFVVPCRYSTISPWIDGKYRVQEIDLWGIVEEDGSTLLSIKYRAIGDLVKGQSLVDAGMEKYYIDSNCNRIIDEQIKLQNGWIKYRRGTKWGIRDSSGKDIVNCEYDEIGSFRGRLIGFINGSFQKLTTKYEYRLKMQCKCTKVEDGRASFSINGVTLRNLDRISHTIGELCTNKHIVNILFSKGQIYVNELTPKNLNKKYAEIDQDSDFALNNSYDGIIVKILKRKRYYVKFDNDKQSYITRGIFLQANKNPNEFKIGDHITLTKKGFDSNYDKTIWQIN